jgi:hypothetical protein
VGAVWSRSAKKSRQGIFMKRSLTRVTVGLLVIVMLAVALGVALAAGGVSAGLTTVIIGASGGALAAWFIESDLTRP